MVLFFGIDLLMDCAIDFETFLDPMLDPFGRHFGANWIQNDAQHLPRGAQKRQKGRRETHFLRRGHPKRSER